MNKREIAEIKKLFTKERCCINRLAGCYVDAEKNKVLKFREAFLSLPEEEMYCEFFDIPKPDDLVFISWYAGGEVFRSGCTWTRGYGKIFYFQPGHETQRSYYVPEVRKILKNAVRWAAPVMRIPEISCPHAEVSAEAKYQASK